MSGFKPTCLLTRLLCAFAVSILVFFSACDSEGDPEMVDTTKPTLSFISPVAGSVLKNIVSIQVQASDDKNVAKVEVFVDGVSLHSFNAAPYLVDWNTKDVAEGVHVIKAVATDDNGNMQAVEISVTVQNINVLITVNVPGDFYETGAVSNKWIVLHDKNWSIITAGRIKAGETLQLVAPSDFADETFTVTEIGILNKGPEPFVHAISYLEVEKGEWVVSDEPNLIEDIPSINLSFKNPHSTNQYKASTNAGFYGGAGSTNVYQSQVDERLIYMAKSPSKLYVREVFKENAKFFMNTDLHLDGNSYIQDLASVTNAGVDNVLEKETFELKLSEPTFVMVDLMGLAVENDFNEAYFIGTFVLSDDDDALTIEHPKASTNTFAQYASRTYLLTESFMATNSVLGKYDITPLPVDYQLNDLSTTSARLTVSGELDAFNAYFFSESVLESYFSIMGPAVNGQEIKIPALPDSVTADFSFVDLSSLPLSPSLYFTDVINADDYSDLMAKTKQENAGFFGPLLLEYRTLYLMEDDSDGGRKSDVRFEDQIRRSPQIHVGYGELRFEFKRK